jgi:hypothetical protein
MTGRTQKRQCSSSMGASPERRPFSRWRWSGVLGKIARTSLGRPCSSEEWMEERSEGLSRQIAGAVFTMAVLLIAANTPSAAAQTASQAQSAVNAVCRVEGIDYQGWEAQQVSNRWVHVVIVPQNGGRLLQVSFDGHAYLFANPKFAGTYIQPSEEEWFNYGGDKLWLLREGDGDEQHWRSNSDLLDDGPYNFRKVSDAQGCGIELTGPLDAHTGIQFSRRIRLQPDSPHIAFRASNEKCERPHTGRVLWHFNAGQTMRASPMAYAVDGAQYVALSAGSDVFSFSLLH